MAESFQSKEHDATLNNDTVDEDDSGSSKAMGRPRYPMQTSRDTAMNRIQVDKILDKVRNIC
jgi:hypothetical protein